jgi:HSP20 family protein
MLLRYDPFRELDRLTEAFGARGLNVAPLDAYRDGDQFHVLVDLPGVDPENIDLTVERDVLTIKAQRSWPEREGVETLVAERPQGSVTRRLLLGQTVSSDDIQANYDQGVLHLTIPSAETARVRKVEVTSGPAAMEGGAIEANHKEAASSAA